MKAFLNNWMVVALLILVLLYSCDGSDIRKLRKDVRELKGDSISLTLESDGYQVIRHQLGSATLNLKEITAHEKGSAIALEIGNLISAPLTGATMEVGYQDPSNPSVERSLPYKVQQTLGAGKATKVTLVLEGVKPSAITYIRISNFQPKGVVLELK